MSQVRCILALVPCMYSLLATLTDPGCCLMLYFCSEDITVISLGNGVSEFNAILAIDLQVGEV